MSQLFERYYQKTIAERRAILASYLGEAVDMVSGLDEAVANQMIENYVLNYDMPFGILPHISVNGVSYAVPMATEEPSVIAAASNGAKRLGDIQASVQQRELIGQILVMQVADLEAVPTIIAQRKDYWLQLAAEACPAMVARGGGPRECWGRILQDEADTFVSIYLSLDPCDAMGANVMNTVLEAITPVVVTDLDGERLISILSNHGARALVSATVKVPVADLHANVATGQTIAKRIAAASKVAQLDPHRAVTHNKGIMNGVDAVLIATGNDWRAVEAGVHEQASTTGQYRGLSQWRYDATAQCLIGEITLPLQVATVGGTLAVHPTAKFALQLLGNPSAPTLATIIAAVGLAQNFAALRALVTEGIQKGHMALQARSLALQVGANLEEVPQLVKLLRKEPRMDRTIATQLLERLRQ